MYFVFVIIKEKKEASEKPKAVNKQAFQRRAALGRTDRHTRNVSKNITLQQAQQVHMRWDDSHKNKKKKTHTFKQANNQSKHKSWLLAMCAV